MKTILRNFFSVLRRFKAASVLNVLGLSIAFCGVYAHYDAGELRLYVRLQPSECRCYLPGGYRTWKQRIAGYYLPSVRTGIYRIVSHKRRMSLNAWVGSPFFYVEQNGQRTGYRENAWEVTPGLLDVIHFDMLEGTAQALDEPGSVILPESMAKKIFGNETAVGKQLIAPNVEMNAQIIKGVYKDFPRNSALQNVIYVAMNPKENYDNWGNWNYFFFVRLDDPANKENVLDNFKSNFNAKEVFGNEFEWGGEESFDLRLTSLPDVHFLNNVDFDSMPKASRQTLLVLFSIAFVIIIIAGINFTNFSTALTPMRIKSINTQKVLGSSDRMLRGSLLVEAVGVSTFAYLLSLLFLYVIPKTPVASLVDADISFGAQPMIIAGTAVIAVIVGVLAGLYPFLLCHLFPPALVLKGELRSLACRTPDEKRVSGNPVLGFSF